MTLWYYITYSLLTIYALLVVASVYTVLYERRDPTKAFGWIVVLILLPVVGLIFFIFFGQSYRKRKIFNLKALNNLKRIELFSQWQLTNIDRLPQGERTHHVDIVKLLLQNSKTPLLSNNTIDILNDGKETFPAIFEALASAKHHIHFEYYIIEDDELGQKLLEILCRKAREGVEVRFLYDDVGSWSLPRSYRSKLKRAGVRVASFMPVVFPYLTSKANFRNHRKIVVVDGNVGFMGGLNFAKRYLDGTKNGVWRDTHLRIYGEAVRMLQATFFTDWYATTSEIIRDNSQYFPSISGTVLKGHACQLALSGPDSDFAVIHQAFFAAIARAKDYIYISTPYFLPGEALLTALKVAALSGVDVRVVLPSRSDSKLVHWASRSYFTELLEAKVGIYLYKKGFNHSKVMVIDGTFCSIGSANMDSRSLEDNFEITAMVYNEELAEEMKGNLLLDIEDSLHVTLQWWEGRKRKDNFKESAARLFSPLL